jgi:hypothetical protein
VAVSADGWRFRLSTPGPVGVVPFFYLRLWRSAADAHWWAMGKSGLMLVSADPWGARNWSAVGNPFPGSDRWCRGAWRADHPCLYRQHEGVRHVGVLMDGDAGWVYYTNTGDAPESLWRRRLWRRGEASAAPWALGAAQLVLVPQAPFEGGDEPTRASSRGVAHVRERSVRDPFLWRADGRTWLMYAAGGEQVLAVAEVLEGEQGADASGGGGDDGDGDGDADPAVVAADDDDDAGP